MGRGGVRQAPPQVPGEHRDGRGLPLQFVSLRRHHILSDEGGAEQCPRHRRGGAHAPPPAQARRRPG
eukprot:3782435-Alexandrium_andersonii.AAC.1